MGPGVGPDVAAGHEAVTITPEAVISLIATAFALVAFLLMLEESIALRAGRDPISNMFPTTACIAILAVFQAGFAMLVRPVVARWLERRRVWKGVVAANGVAMTVFVWHMTALLIVIKGVNLLGLQMLSRPTTAWWVQRPLWLVAPGVILAGFIGIFARIEQRSVAS